MTRHVLVVEDEPLIRLDAVSMLEGAGLSVLEFDRADDALDYTREHLDDVAGVFTDINLRGTMDGIDLALELAHADPSIVIVVTSGRYVTRPRLLPDSAVFVKKPWMPVDVLRAMQDATARD